jgi:hypothetical protein
MHHKTKTSAHPLVTILALLLTPALTRAQWDIEDSNTTASLRGIHNEGGGVAWASGTNGTVLRTEDGGYLWQTCTIPPGAEKLDFRGIQAFDENTAIVMSSGKGDLSRLYKTTDGCRTWKLLFTNPDPEGFWDAMSFWTPSTATHLKSEGVLIGDPVGGSFPIFVSADGGANWKRWGGAGSRDGTTCAENQPNASSNEALFAASNESLSQFFGSSLLFVTGGPSGARLFYSDSSSLFGDLGGPCKTHFATIKLPLAHGNSSSGAFAIAVENKQSYFPLKLIIVGGDYTKPHQTSGTAAYVASKDGMHLPMSSYFNVTTPQTPPHGYRSAVAYDPTTKTWITVGPNGTDISRDDGKNWSPLKPTTSEPPDADKNWNALSLPFVVGPKGRIGKLRGDALKP